MVVDSKMLGVFYHRRLYRGYYIYIVHAKNARVQEMVASMLLDYKIPMVPWKVYKAATEMNTIEKGLHEFKKTFAKIVGATLSSEDRRSLGRRHWNVHGDILKSIADDDYMQEQGLTGWAAATPTQLEGRQKAHTNAKIKCVTERGGLAKASREVVDYVGNLQMPKWAEGNRESVEMYAIELRHQLAYYFKDRVQYPPTAEEYVPYEAPPPAKDPNADHLTYPEETLTPEEGAQASWKST